ncbi:MAG: PAS domain-containing protein [Ancalomicrobiaceae bacterium]|nr:PAS domain-containing protein [Ancalomicrobiaceae bacterium]
MARHAAEILETSYGLAEVEAARTDLRQREALLQATRASLAVAHELGRTGNYRFNLVTHSNWWSEEIFRFYGLDPLTTKLTLDVFRSGIHEDDRDRLLHEIGESFRHRTARTTHYRTRHPDGVVRYVMTSFRPANEEPDGDFIGTNVDLTDRRAAVERTRAVQAELARMLRLSTLNELASSLILGISQPLTAIVASAAAALRWLDRAPQHREDVRESLASINRSGERVSKYIGILRSLASRAIPQASPVPVDPAISDVIPIAVSEAETRGISFDWSLGCGDRQVLGDRSQIQQLFLSLATSAFRVARTGPDGETRVSASTAADTGGHVALLVAFDASDEACGVFDLSADSADVAGSSAEVTDLWLSRTIAESCSGTLTMEGSDIDGRRFVVRLPAQPDTDMPGRDDPSDGRSGVQR